MAKLKNGIIENQNMVKLNYGINENQNMGILKYCKEKVSIFSDSIFQFYHIQFAIIQFYHIAISWLLSNSLKFIFAVIILQFLRLLFLPLVAPLVYFILNLWNLIAIWKMNFKIEKQYFMQYFVLFSIFHFNYCTQRKIVTWDWDICGKLINLSKVVATTRVSAHVWKQSRPYS